jgi:hypothetical protein
MRREGKKHGLFTNKTIRYGGKGMYTIRNNVEIKSRYCYETNLIKLGVARYCLMCGKSRYYCKAITIEMNQYGRGIYRESKKYYVNYISEEMDDDI